MSRAEELAKWHEAMAAEPKRNEGKRKRHAESAAELRRLSSVEAELIALKKAIGDAEPVAVALRFGSDPRLCLSTVFDTNMEAQEYANRTANGAHLEPLYTLKGIK